MGKVEGLAAGETIFAARFFGETAFLVTFRRVDPLFAIDLRDPAAPTVAGELKIPGFSHYLHPVQDGFLIGLGRDADEATGQPGQPQLSLFNVDNLAQPELVDQFLIELGGWGFSDAFFDHHAIGYFPSYKILVLPFQESGWFPLDFLETGPREAWRPRYGFWVFQLQPDNGEDAIEFLGESSTIRRRCEACGSATCCSLCRSMR